MGMPCLTQLVCQQSSPAPGEKELASGLWGLPWVAWLLLAHVSLSLAWHRGTQSWENEQDFADAILFLSWVWVWRRPSAGSRSHCVGLLSWKLEILTTGVALRGLWLGPGCQKDQAGDLQRAGESWPGMGMEEKEGKDNCSRSLCLCLCSCQGKPLLSQALGHSLTPSFIMTLCLPECCVRGGGMASLKQDVTPAL